MSPKSQTLFEAQSIVPFQPFYYFYRFCRFRIFLAILNSRLAGQKVFGILTESVYDYFYPKMESISMATINPIFILFLLLFCSIEENPFLQIGLCSSLKSGEKTGLRTNQTDAFLRLLKVLEFLVLYWVTSVFPARRALWIKNHSFPANTFAKKGSVLSSPARTKRPNQ